MKSMKDKVLKDPSTTVQCSMQSDVIAESRE